MTTGTFEAWHVPAGAGLPTQGPDTTTWGDATVATLRGDGPWTRRLLGLLENRRGGLLSRPVASIAASIGTIADRFLDPGDTLRARAVASLPHTSGLSPAMAEAVLDGMAADWTQARIERMLAAEFVDPGVLDGFRAGPGGRMRALAPGLSFQVVAGSVPGVGATALVRALLAKSPTLIKPGRGDVVLPVLFARALAEVDPDLGSSVAVVYWPGGETEGEGVALRRARLVTVYGSDDAVDAVRRRVPVTTRFVPYHHRVSFGVVGRDALRPELLHRTASEAAGAVAFFDQRGCVSPHVLFVEEGEGGGGEEFARALASSLAVVEDHLPGGGLDTAEAARLQQERGAAELRAAAGAGVFVVHGGGASWTVIFDPHAALTAPCVGRLVRVRPVSDVREVPRLVAPLGAHLQTAGVAGVGDRLEALAEDLARAGVMRIADLPDVPFPPPWWHHDGEGPIRSLVRWVDLEG